MKQRLKKMKIEIIHREAIKPLKPTPPNLKFLNLSFLEQLTPSAYISLVLFYSKNNENGFTNFIERSQKLKASLSNALTHYYPFAGRLKDNACIDCNDNGADFIMSRVHSCLVSEFFENPDVSLLENFLPVKLDSDEANRGGPLLLVQANFFDSGDIVIGVSICHKLVDASTISTFIVDCWSSISLNGSANVISPDFSGPHIFPPMKNFPVTKKPAKDASVAHQHFVTKWLVFDALSVAKLKHEAASVSVKDPTRVEAVSALVWKCAMNASKLTSSCSKSSAWAFPANMRKRLMPPLQKSYAGNCLGFSVTKSGDQGELQELVGLPRKGLREFIENHAKKLQGDMVQRKIQESVKEFGKLATDADLDLYICSSWCKFGMYNADLGFGKPIWWTIVGTNSKNVIGLTDTKGGYGVAARITLSEPEMALFLSNEELLKFASVNPVASSSAQ